MIVFICPNVGAYGNASSRTGCHVISNNQSARCAARHGRRSDGIGPIKTACGSQVQVAVILHVNVRVDHVVLRIDFSLDVVFLDRFSVVSNNKVSAVKVGFFCFQAAAVDFDEAVINGELAGVNVTGVVDVTTCYNNVVPNGRAAVGVLTTVVDS